MSSARPPRLGRGLAALLGDVAKPDPSIEHAIRLLPVEALQPGPFQPRGGMAEEALESLAESIRASGILQPILVRPAPDEADRYQIVAGERRWRAAQRAGLHEVPCLVRKLTDTESMAAGLVENLQRQDLNAMEEAEGYRRLAEDFAMLHEEVARIVGKSRAHVSNMLRLLGLPDTVQTEVRNGALSAGHARALLPHPDAAKLALGVIARGLNVRQTEQLVQQQLHPAPRRQVADRETDVLERELSAQLGLNVKIRFDGKAGTLTIGYRTLDQLEMVLALLQQRQ